MERRKKRPWKLNKRKGPEERNEGKEKSQERL